ncbi:site-specific integrase [Candidatus Parcubacteria bacterium]|nr:MAG: site-specific integrase [Candidatus Parcubacteria bacterium]
MASFEKRGKRWRVRLRINGADMSRSFATKAEAKAWAAQMEAEASAGTLHIAPAHLTVGDLLRRYLEQETPKKRGQRSETIRIKRMLGEGKADTDPLCHIPLNRVGRADIVDWRERRLKEIAPASVARELSTIKAVFTWATRELGWYNVSPAANVSPPQKSPPRVRRVTDDEVALLMTACGLKEGMQPYNKTQEAVHAFRLAIETAMRAGEILSLRWEHVDFARRVAHLEITKNGDPRDVPLSSRAVELLRMMEGKHPQKVFTVSPKTMDVLFRRVRDMADLKDLHFHDSRAEALTRLSKKVDVMRLARISGHRDIKILYNTYYRETAEDIAKLLD